FKDTEPSHRDPSAALLADIKEKLHDRRHKFEQLTDPSKNPENEVARLAVELKHSGAEREIPAVEGELAEAESLLRRQQVLQSARELLKQRIQEKISEMT